MDLKSTAIGVSNIRDRLHSYLSYWKSCNHCYRTALFDERLADGILTWSEAVENFGPHYLKIYFFFKVNCSLELLLMLIHLDLIK